jgi:hypothetical protein
MLGLVTTILVLSLMAVAPCVGRAAANDPKHEVWLGLGGAASFEKTVFNVPNDVASTPDMMISLGYMLNLDARRALGIHLYGGSELTPAVLVQTPTGSQFAEFELNTYNLGLRYRQSFARGGFSPYAFIGGSLVAGGTSGGGISDLHFSGGSLCAGPGICLPFGRNFMLSAEGIGSFGVATWDPPALANSSGTKFNPSLVGVTVNLSAMWGTRPASRPTPTLPAVEDSLPAVPRPVHNNHAAQIIMTEAVIALISSAAYDNEKGTLPGITLATGILGVSAGQDFKNPKSPLIILASTFVISTAEFVLANNGASKDALFVTSVSAWNLVYLTVGLAERKAGREAPAQH